jgi:hypothetical protein
MVNKISYRLLLWILVWFSLLGSALAFFGYWEMNAIKSGLAEYHLQTLDKQPIEAIAQFLTDYNHLYWQILGAGLAITGLLLWLTLRFSLSRAIRGYGTRAIHPSDPQKRKHARIPEPTAQEQRSHVQDDQRRALHLLSLLQREGRLLDFLGENLQSYDDGQIGAAVRGIHESCRKAINKYLAPEAVIDRTEGEEITIPAEFDPNAIKLTGNVSGEPPFKGILQHRGWRSGRFDLPTLSGSQDPAIIAPAEVEIE